MSLLFDPTLTALHRGLNARMERQAVVAANVANVDTPGYHARALHFEQALQRANAQATARGTLHTTDARHLAMPGEPKPPQTEVTVSEADGRVDGNNVVLEQEMATLAQNNVEFSALSTLTRKRLGLMRYTLMNG
ncbi:MAG: flagellar basal body rod protein FlgB [Myxococcota bacterium]